ncbi:MAG: hypothetical protein R2839_05070 [Thermomicrobiales bacterium]
MRPFSPLISIPVGMVVLPDVCSLLVGSSNPTGGTYFSSTAELVRLIDADGDGVADGSVETVATGLAGMVTAVAVHGDLVAVTSVESGRERIQLLRATEDWTGTYVLLGEMTFAFDTSAHQSYGLAMWNLQATNRLSNSISTLAHQVTKRMVGMSRSADCSTRD